MIIEAEIISQPYSGEYTEIIYDNESAWNSQSWTFIKFTNDNRNQIINNLLEKIIIIKSNFQDLEKLHSMSNTDENLNCLCKKYFIYDEQILNILFNCDGERYINKCLDIENYLPISLDSKYEIQIDKSLLGGYYQKKYLKYKNKYISLKIILK